MPDNFGFVPDNQTASTTATAPGAGGSSANDFGFTADGGGASATAGGGSSGPTGGQSTGFLQSMAQSAAQPFLQMARLPAGLLAQGIGAITGNKTMQQNGADAGGNMPYDFGYLGKVNAAGYDANGKPLSFGGATAQAVGAGLQIAPWFVGAGEAGAAADAAEAAAAKPAVGAGMRILKGIGAGAGIGAAQVAGGALQSGAENNNLDLGTVAGAGLSGGLAGAATAGVLSSAGELGSKLLADMADRTPGAKLQAQADNLKSLTNAIRDSKTNPVETITDMIKSTKQPLLQVKEGKVDASLLLDAIGGAKRDVNTAAADIVKNMQGSVNLGEFQSKVEDAIRANSTLRGSGGVTKALTKLDSMFEDYVKSYGPKAEEGAAPLTAKDVSVPYGTLNEIRQSMNQYFDKDTVDLERTVANTARGYLYDAKTGSPALQKLMQKWGALDDAENFSQKLNTTAIKGGRLGKYLADLAGVGVGTTMGAPLGPLGAGVGAVVGGATTDKAMNMLQSGYFKPSMMAAPASTLSRFVGSAPVKNAAQIGGQLLIRGAANSASGGQ